MMNDANRLPNSETPETGKMLVTKGEITKRETPVIPLPIEKKLPSPAPSEFTVDSWQMPPVQKEYLKGRDHDCL